MEDLMNLNLHMAFACGALIKAIFGPGDSSVELRGDVQSL